MLMRSSGAKAALTSDKHLHWAKCATCRYKIRFAELNAFKCQCVNALESGDESDFIKSTFT
jgi:hypothetical protein